MRALICLFALTNALLAQGPRQVGLVQNLRPHLGMDPLEQIRLAPPGCWDALLLGANAPPLQGCRATEGTVEIWDQTFHESPHHQVFRLYLDTLRQRLSRALTAPPPGHGRIELSELMASDPSSPQKLDLTKVKSMQDRFNRLPPNGSPVK